jgi:hypothetical protein
MVVQNGVSYSATAQQIANLNANGGTVTSVTAQSPLSGGTITTTGTIGVTDSSITNQYLSTMPANTIKGNNAAGVAAVKDLTAAQVLAMIGGGTVSSITAGTGLTTSGTNPITTSGTISLANTSVTAGNYGTASSVPSIAINAQGQITSALNTTISIPSGQVTGLGTMATQNANAVAITGGAINQTAIGGTTPAAATFTNLTATGTTNFNTISSGTWQGTPIAVAYGGTGATTAAGARTNLGVAASGANSDITSLSGLTTPLSETQGGTGYGSYTTGDILYASSSTTLARLNDVATGNALISGGVGVAPSYGKIGLTTHVSGILPVANGGTGATTLTGYLVGNGTSAFTAVATIPNAGLTNSSITIGSTSIALGASTSTLAGLTTVTVTQDPTASLQLSTKQYVDNQVATVSNTTFHTASAAATTANLTATYNNGTAGVGATLTNSGAQAAFAVDGYTASLNDRILVKDQTTGAQNGIYTVTTLGSGSTNWVLTRATDFNTVGTGPNFIETGASTFVSGGTTWGSTSWVMNTTGTITVGSTSLVWVQTSSAGNIQVSAPITKTGNTIGLGTVGVANGGTGLITLTAYGLLYAASTSSVGQISPSTSGYPLLSTGASTAPAFGQLALGGAGVTGTLGVTNGGTGTATAFTTGSVVFAGASGVYSQNNAKFFWDNTNNRLGVNTATPQTQLTIVSNTQTTTPSVALPAGTDLYIVGANAANTRITQDAYGTGAYGAFTARMARGTAASPTASQSGDFLAQFTARGYGATGFGTASTGYIAFSAAENFTDTAQGTYAGIYTTPTGSNSIVEAFRFGPTGQLGIGGATYGTSGYVLTSGGASAAPTWSQISLTSSVTGTLPATNGGTGQSSYAVGDLLYASSTTALSRLADVATGNVLLSGGVNTAPSWGQVSLSAAVTGTLPAANGGTGNNTYTIGDLLYASSSTALSRLSDVVTGSVLVSGGTGVAPAWSSTPTVTTLNYTTAVGATSETVPLVIGGTTASSTLSLRSTSGTGTSDAIQFQVGSNGATTAMYINTSGNVGIGTTSPSSYGKLAVVAADTVNALFLQSGTGSLTYAAFSGASYLQTNNDFYIGNGGAYPLVLRTNATERMRIDSSGNVGIGTTSPSSTLHLYRNSTIQTSLNIESGASASYAPGIYLSDSRTGTVKQFQLQVGGYANAFSIIDQTASAVRFLIDTNGNVGIGTTSPGGFKLNVSDGTTNFVINPSSTIGYIGTTGNYPVAFLTNNTERMRIDSSGNVGIGTTSPGYKLDVNGAVNAGSGFNFGSSNNYLYQSSSTSVTLRIGTTPSYLSFIDNSGNPGVNGAGGVLLFQTGGIERMRIDSSGNLLVGTTTSPSGSGNLVVPQVYTGTSATAANVYVDSTGKFFRSTASATASGTLIRAPQILTSGTSYTTPAGCNSIYVETVGGGGGGGVGSQYGAGGGGGGYAAKYFSVSPSTSYTYGIGAGGSGSSSTTGSSGGNTTFTVSSTTITGSGGSGGAGSSTATSGGTGTNGDLNITGGSGGGSNGNFGGAFTGQGGNSFFGSGAPSAAGTGNLSGSNGTGYGSGGGGSYKNGGSTSGGNGTQGIIRIWEYT